MPSSVLAVAVVCTLAVGAAGCAGPSQLGAGQGPSALSAPPAADSSAVLRASLADPQGASPAAAPRPTTKTIPASVPTGGSLALARALRDKGDRSRALAELEKGRAARPADREIAREKGIVALELGQLDKARLALESALDPATPDWHTLSALGTVHSLAGNQRLAQEHYKRALALKPDHKATLNNLALSYALDGNLAEAERTLKPLTSGEQTPRQVKENLALVQALSGKYEAAEKTATGILPKEKARSNVAWVRTLTAPAN